MNKGKAQNPCAKGCSPRNRLEVKLELSFQVSAQITAEIRVNKQYTYLNRVTPTDAKNRTMYQFVVEWALDSQEADRHSCRNSIVNTISIPGFPRWWTSQNQTIKTGQFGVDNTLASINVEWPGQTIISGSFNHTAPLTLKRDAWLIKEPVPKSRIVQNYR